MTTNNKTCICCKKNRFTKIYEGSVRSGTFGKTTNDEYRVLECDDCKLKFLDPMPSINYESDEYRLQYNGSCQTEDYLDLHDQEQNERLLRIGVENFRDKVVLDYGCGGGSFLDCVKGLCSKTIAIEPFTGFHEGLKSRGHEIFSSAKEALDIYGEKIDVLISFGVIEHTDNPLNYLLDAKSFLSPSGKLYLETDNSDDFLMKCNLPEFNRFFYRTAHYWYFDPQSITAIFETAGFTDLELSFRHNYDLSNAFMWMKERIPTGNERILNITKTLNLTWKNFLEETGQADLLFCSGK